MLKNEIRDYSWEEYNKIFYENYTDFFWGYDRFIDRFPSILAEDEKNTPLTKMKKDIYFYRMRIVLFYIDPFRKA